MSNPFITTLKANPQQFLGAMETRELEVLSHQIIEQLIKKAKGGDRAAVPALMQIGRIIGEIEI